MKPSTIFAIEGWVMGCTASVAPGKLMLWAKGCYLWVRLYPDIFVEDSPRGCAGTSEGTRKRRRLRTGFCG
jgi:hypothetical protein